MGLPQIIGEGFRKTIVEIRIEEKHRKETIKRNIETAFQNIMAS